MDTKGLLRQMCHEILSEADIRAIAKVRGFTPQQASSRSLFENFYLSLQGVETVMQTLSSQEIGVLHLLHFTGETVTISFFERIYGNPENRGYGTVTQRYKDVLNEVKNNLVRRGVLLMGEVQSAAIPTKIERLRFQFPEVFGQFLPSLLKETVQIEGAGKVLADGFREHLIQIMKAAPADTRRNKLYELSLSEGSLWIGKQAFSVQALLNWQFAGWEAEVIKQTPLPKRGLFGYENSILSGYTTIMASGRIVSPVPVVMYALSRLGDGEWVLPAMLTDFLRIFYSSHDFLAAEKICEIGWKWGCLAGIEHQKKMYYRLPYRQSSQIDPADYLTIQTDGSVLIAPLKVPYESLEVLGQIAILKISGSHLQAIPSLARLGEVLPTLQQHPLLLWLVQHSSAFNKALNTAKKRWGQIIVHDKLMVARVTDLSLRVRVQKAFENQVVLIGEEWLVFPVGLMGEVMKVVKKAGHVIKWVEND